MFEYNLLKAFIEYSLNVDQTDFQQNNSYIIITVDDQRQINKYHYEATESYVQS